MFINLEGHHLDPSWLKRFEGGTLFLRASLDHYSLVPKLQLDIKSQAVGVQTGSEEEGTTLETRKPSRIQEASFQADEHVEWIGRLCC